MKKLLTLALILTSATAFATRSRITALGNAPHLIDVSYVYGNPSDIMILTGDSLTIESGKTNVVPGVDTTSQGAEGLLIRSMGTDAKMAISLGHDDDSIFAMRKLAKAGNVAVATIAQQNPLEVSYGMKMGDTSIAGTLVYSNFENKLAGSEQKENSMALKFGATGSVWSATAALVLADKWQNSTGATLNDYKAATGIALTGSYDVMSDLYLYGGLATGGYKSTASTVDAQDYSSTEIKVGAISKIEPKDASAKFFYGAGLTSTTTKEKVADTKTNDLHLPLIIGLEAEANSWLTVRGSVTQNLLLVDSSKTEAAGTTTAETNPGANSTTLAAGAGLKFNKVVVDGSILAAGSQVLNSANLLGQVGLTYAF